MDRSLDATKIYYRCEGCGAFLTVDEIENGDGHAVTEYVEGQAVGRALCGPVSKGAWHE